MTALRILMAAGGTGGHVTPALATADALRKLSPSSSIFFLTDGRPVAEKFFAGAPYGREMLFPDHAVAPRKTQLGAWLRAYGRARDLVRDFEPDVVVGFGGYPTLVAGVAALGPPLAAAWRYASGSPASSGRPPLVLLEQNAHPGRAVSWLARVADSVLLTLPASRSHLSRSAREVHVTGNPLPPDFQAGAPCAPDPAAFGLERGRPTLLVLGGSQGARGVNRMVLEARSALAASCPALQIYFITGDADHGEVLARIREQPEPRTIAVAFERRMRQLYELADVVVARGGGTTLAELAIVGRPMVLIPYPHHKDRHQYRNAEEFERAGAARIVPEGGDASAALLRHVAAWLGDPAARAAAGAAARTLGHPDAAIACARRILHAGTARAERAIGAAGAAGAAR